MCKYKAAILGNIESLKSFKKVIEAYEGKYPNDIFYKHKLDEINSKIYLLQSILVESENSPF